MDGGARRAEEADASAQVQANRLDAVIDAIADGVLIYDAEGRLLRLNRAMRAMLHLDEAFRPGAETLEQRDAPFKVADETGRPLPKDAWPTARVLRGEVLGGAGALDLRVTLPDGGVLLVSMSGAPVRDQGGRVVNAVLVVHDVTERRQAAWRTRAALDALVHMAQALIQEPPPEPTATASGAPASPDDRLGQQMATFAREILGCRRAGITIYDGDARQHRPLAITGLDGLAATAWWEEMQREIMPHSHAFWRVGARLAAGEVVLGDTTTPPFDQLTNPLGIGAFLVAPMLVGERLVGYLFADFGDAHGPAELAALAQGVAALAGLALDRHRIAAASMAEARRAELERLRAEFIAMVSHDLQTPLTAVRAALGLLTTSIEHTLAPDQRELLAMTRFNVERLRVQIDDFLAANQLVAGTLRLELTNFDLRSAVRNALGVVRPLLLDKGQTVEVDMPAPLPVVGDRRRLEHVLVNLLANAHRHTPTGSHASINGRVEGGEVIVAVRDDGPGIPPAELERIFERFHRLDSAAGGSGLGLAIARALAAMQQGRLWAESQPGEGAAFILALPLAPEGGRGDGA